ncbi:hypothetical protein SAMN05444157_1172 [Frankineae bacterium MT45]|nr:hypothetical protein SAMN05444157_1172 [Frankineae bacterium MT45]
MESNQAPENPDDPGSALAVANQTRQRLAASLRLPTGFYPKLAAAIAVQVGTAAFGIASQTPAGLVVALAGVAFFLAVAALLLRQFRRTNGVKVDGLASQIVLGSAITSTLIYVAAIGVATWAAFASRWWLVAVASGVGGVGYAYGVVRWWHAYQLDPAPRAGGASSRVLVALAVVAVAGLAVLLIAG